MFILYIFCFTDIIPDIIPGSCSDDETNVANVYLIKSLYCKSFIVPISFRGRCSDDEANAAKVYLYLANFLLCWYLSSSCSDDETNVANFYIANLFWRWNKCCKCLYCKSFIVLISFRQLFWRQDKCCKSYQILILQIFYCTDIFLAIVLTMRQAERVLRLTRSKARSQRRNTRRRRNNFELSLDFLWICVNFCPTVHGLKLWWWQHWRICAMHWPSLRTKNLIIAFLHSKPETCHNMMICIN